MKKKYNKNTFYSLLLIFPLSFFCFFVKFSFMPSKMFIDSNYILTLMTNNIEKKGTAFYVTAEIFKKINFLGFSTLKEWSLFLTIIFTIITFVILLKNDKYSLKEYTFIYASFALLNLFVFNLSKDIIQFLFFLSMFCIAYNKKITNFKKTILISIILLLETLYFRAYYILILYAFILLNIIYRNIKNSTLDGKNIFKIIIVSLLVFLLPIALSQYLFPTQYYKLINVRDEVTAVLNANTEINNVLYGNNFLIFTLNYIINGFRIFFPVELLTKGISQIFFALYQFVLSFSLIKWIKKIDRNNMVSIILVISYFLGAIVFEPDFGSVVRHEITLIFFFIFMNKEGLG